MPTEIESQTAVIEECSARLNKVFDEVESIRIELDRALRHISFRNESVPAIRGMEIGDKVFVKAEDFERAMRTVPLYDENENLIGPVEDQRTLF